MLESPPHTAPKNGAAPLKDETVEVDRDRLFALQVEIYYEQSCSSMIVAPILYALLVVLQ